MDKRNEIIDDDDYGDEILDADDFFGWLADVQHEELMLKEEN